MQRYFILFYDPNYGINIEDILCDQKIEYEISKTPEELLEVDPLFCKTLIVTHESADVMQELQQNKQLHIAGLFNYSPELGYISVPKKGA